MRGKFLGVAFAALAAGALAFTGVASAQDKKVTIGVSIPAADHGWTAGVVYHAERVAKLLMQEHPGLNVIVKTSPDAASRQMRCRIWLFRGLMVLSCCQLIQIRWSMRSRKSRIRALCSAR